MSAFRSLCLIFALSLVALAPQAMGSAGSVRFAKDARTGFGAPNRAQRSFMRSHYWRVRAYSPYFDSRLAWEPNAWAYQDAYAIYPSGPVAAEHPDWILRDAWGRQLWIDYRCSNGSCTQYAADIGNPAFRDWWIAAAKAKLAAGYKGIFIDDVNMAERVSDGYGVDTMPVDPRTGLPMSEADWQRYMADFMVQVRAALPGVEIVHNALWPVGDQSPALRAELGAANYIELERGFNDAGIVGGSGRFGFDTLLRFIDDRHAAGQGVILDGPAVTPSARLYGLAAYFLVSSGRDALANEAAGAPSDWWSGYDVKLGRPLGGRYARGGVWRRDFSRGSVLLNEPGSTTHTVRLGSGYRDLSGRACRSVRLPASSGAVLVRSRHSRRT
jgi:hypothetical protein